MITLEPGSEVHRRRTKDRSLVVDRERDRLCPTKEEGRNLREEIEGRMRRSKDVREGLEGGRRGRDEVDPRTRRDEGRRIGGRDPEGRGKSWMVPRLSSPAVQVSPNYLESSTCTDWLIRQ